MSNHFLIIVIILILLDCFELHIVSFKEGVYSLNQWELKELWKLKHHCFGVFVLILHEEVVKKHLNRLVLIQLHGDSKGGAEVKVDLDYEVLFTEIDFAEVLVGFVVYSLADLLNKRAFNVSILILSLSEATSDFLWECDAEITDGLALQHFLALIEFISDKLIKVIVKHKVLEFGQLHGQKLLLNLVKDEVGLTGLEVAIHVNSSRELGCCNENVLLMVVFVDQELLVTKLKHH